MIPWWIRRHDTHVPICHPVIDKSKYDKNINIFPPSWLNYDTQTKAKPLFSHIVHQSPLFDHWNICVQRGGALQNGCGWNAVSRIRKYLSGWAYPERDSLKRNMTFWGIPSF